MGIDLRNVRYLHAVCGSDKRNVTALRLVPEHDTLPWRLAGKRHRAHGVSEALPALPMTILTSGETEV